MFTEQIRGNRKNLDKRCTKEELDSIKLIRNKVTCSSQALDPRAIVVPPAPPQIAPKEVHDEFHRQRTVFEEQARMFVKGAIDAKAEATFLEEDWWSTMIAHYGLEGNVFIDFSTGDFYILTNSAGQQLDGMGSPVQSSD